MFRAPRFPGEEPRCWESSTRAEPGLGANGGLRAPSAVSSGVCLYVEESWGQRKSKAKGLGPEPGAFLGPGALPSPLPVPPTLDLSRTRSSSAYELTVEAGRDPPTDQVTSRAQFLSKTWESQEAGPQSTEQGPQCDFASTWKAVRGQRELV